MKMSLWVVGVLALGGCATEFGTSPDRYETESKHDALEGVSYALPMLQYEVEITRSLSGCQTEFELTAGGKTTKITHGTPNLGIKAKATERYVPGERYVADYRGLKAPFSATAFTLELHANGVLKSVNVSAEDKTAEAAASIVTLGLNIAGLSPPPPPTPSGIKSVLDGEEEALRALAATATKVKRVVCKAGTVKNRLDYRAAAEGQKARAAELRTFTKDVERLTTVANLRRAETSHVNALSDALKNQATHTLAIEALEKDKEELNGGLAVVRKTHWPAEFDKQTSPLAIDVAELKPLATRLAVEDVEVLSATAVSMWIKVLPDDLRKKYREDPNFKRYLKEDDSPADEVEIPAPCSGPTADVAQCLHARLDASIHLSETGQLAPDCKEAEQTEFCIKSIEKVREIDSASYSSWKTPAGRRAFDDIADPGIFVRTPAEGRLTICRGASRGCNGADEILKSDPVRAPQLGQLRFLPFKNGMFEGTSLSLALRDNGTIEKLEYKSTKAAGADAIAAAAKAVEQYKTWRDSRETAAATKLAADRAAQIAALQFEIDLLSKQRDLLKLQATDSPEALQAIRDQTEAINVELALKQAKIADLKAAATLAELAPTASPE